MKKSEYNLVCSYILHNKQALEEEISTMQTNLRFRRVDLTDCIELALAKQRLDTFNEVTGHIQALLNMNMGGSKK